jgi:hypothetical protein
MLLSRANHRRAAGLALFALWLQLALSFGHFHAEDFAGLGTPGAPALARSTPLPVSPLDPFSDGVAHEACAICASMALAECLLLPDPVPLAMPPLHRHSSLAMPGAFVVVGTRHRLFQTRAPPSV